MAKFIPNEKGLQQFMAQLEAQVNEIAGRVSAEMPDADQPALEERLASEYRAARVDLNGQGVRDIAAKIIEVRSQS